jgi:hypothetical protein
MRPITSRGASLAVIAYTITDDDVRGPFVPKIPRDFEGMARLQGLGYRSTAQLLAEKFHTSEELIKLLNPGKTLDCAGTVTVPNAADGRPAGQVFRIEVKKPAKVIRALGRGDELVAFYPASVGSREKPAPSGTYGVRRVVQNAIYHYDPRFRFKGVGAQRKLTIAPRPSNRVGLVWIDLTKASHGIHGTPVRKRSAKPSRMAASGLPIGMPLTLPSEFARARRLRSSTRLEPSPVNSRRHPGIARAARSGHVSRLACGYTLEEAATASKYRQRFSGSWEPLLLCRVSDSPR